MNEIIKISEYESKRRSKVFSNQYIYNKGKEYEYLIDSGELYRDGKVIDKFGRGNNLPYQWAETGKVKIYKVRKLEETLKQNE